MTTFLSKKFSGLLAGVEVVQKEDLDLVKLLVVCSTVKITCKLHIYGIPRCRGLVTELELVSIQLALAVSD